MEEQRLTRIENKMDRIERAMAELATANARIETTLQEFARIDRRLNDHASRVKILEHAASVRGFGAQILWMLFSAGLALAVAWITR